MFPSSFFILIFIFYATAQQAPTVTEKLQDKLLQNYNHLTIPNHKKTVHAQVGLSILHVHVDAATGTLHSQVWLRSTWFDPRLSWNVDEYDVDTLHVRSDLLWKPDILIYNSVTHFQFFPCNALVYPTGKVLWIPPTNLHTYCDLDWTHWPWDTQVCEIKMGSWTRNGGVLNISEYGDEGQSSDSHLSEDFKTTSWDLLPDSYVDTNVKQYEGVPDSYIDITSHLKLKRRDGMDSHLVILPLLASSFLLFAALCTSNSQRLFLTCACCIMLIFQLITIRMILPSQGGSTPKVVSVIGGLLVLAILQLVLEQLVKMFVTGRTPPAILVSQPMLTILCLNGNGANGEEMVSLGEGEEEKGKGTNFFAVVINRICFIIYAVIIVAFFLTILC